MIGLFLIAVVYLYSPWIALSASIFVTVIHVTDEIVGDGGPFWDYVGVSKLSGIAFLTAVHSFGLSMAALGYLFDYRWAVYVLIAVRLIGDGLVFHWIPAIRGRLPNPGLPTTPLLIADSVLATIWLI